MLKKFWLLSLLFCCFACKNSAEESREKQPDTIAFDKTKWAVKEGNDYPYRDSMLHDLIDNVTLKGTTKAQVTALLGTPDRTDNRYLFYTVTQERIGFFPLHTATLVIKLDKNGTVLWRKIHQ